MQNLPPALYTLMRSTEPWHDEYYTLDMEAVRVFSCPNPAHALPPCLSRTQLVANSGTVLLHEHCFKWTLYCPAGIERRGL